MIKDFLHDNDQYNRSIAGGESALGPGRGPERLPSAGGSRRGALGSMTRLGAADFGAEVRGEAALVTAPRCGGGGRG
jgi:hypothetical protein